ncbi:dihydropteroate synthase [Flavobacterium sp.]|uniref:dihydropteroate synthase n=1 Tax=Flavobacterium sp. TaxID=239 RepID=UPI0035293ECD
MLINCLGNLIDLTRPKVMGILNITPNSFYDGGKYQQETEILKRIEVILNEGADFIDIGAYSSKPNADFVSEVEEANRLLPILKLVVKEFPNAIISVDTFRSEIAKLSIENGAAIINDISAGGLDNNMMNIVAKFQVPYIMMHMRGTPQTMMNLTQYDDIVKEMLFYFSEKVTQARSFGINDVIIDPGFGFAKTTEQNYEIMQKLDLFQNLELPILSGVSRKSMIYKPLESSPELALNGTTALNMIALTKGTSILRVHDVKEAVECVKLFSLMRL